eukprot:1361264-Amorphochlora_amoeboformis.AAC.1
MATARMMMEGGLDLFMREGVGRDYKANGVRSDDHWMFLMIEGGSISPNEEAGFGGNPFDPIANVICKKWWFWDIAFLSATCLLLALRRHDKTDHVTPNLTRKCLIEDLRLLYPYFVQLVQLHTTRREDIATQQVIAINMVGYPNYFLDDTARESMETHLLKFLRDRAEVHAFICTDERFSKFIDKVELARLNITMFTKTFPGRRQFFRKHWCHQR